MFEFRFYNELLFSTHNLFSLTAVYLLMYSLLNFNKTTVHFMKFNPKSETLIKLIFIK